MVDGHGIVVQCNPQARDLLDLPSELTDSKPLFFQVLTYQWEHNKSGREDGNFEQFCHKRLIVDRVHSQELIRPDGRIIEVRSVPLKQGGFVRTYTDITIRKGVEAKVAYLAHHDDLTKLVNRAAFQARLEQILAMSKYLRAGAIMYLDLDRFKEVNDKCGHEVGDKVLVEVARRMQLEVRAADTVARLGGDEFAILLPNLENQKWCADLARRLCVTLGRPYFIEGQELFIGSSVGIALFPQDGREGRQLLQRADHALYEAKRAGRNTFRFWTVSSESRMSA